MKLARLLFLFLSIATWFPVLNSAKTMLSDFNGKWTGVGADRASPLEPSQNTKCSANISANLVRMTVEISCNGDKGLQKKIYIEIELSGDDFSGRLTQKSSVEGANPSVLEGTVAGQKTDIRVSFPGFTPSASVSLKLINASTFSMQASTLGAQLMDLTFHRNSGK